MRSCMRRAKRRAHQSEEQSAEPDTAALQRPTRSSSALAGPQRASAGRAPLLPARLLAAPRCRACLAAARPRPRRRCRAAPPSCAAARTVDDAGVLVEAVVHVGARVVLGVLLPELGVVADALEVALAGLAAALGERAAAGAVGRGGGGCHGVCVCAARGDGGGGSAAGAPGGGGAPREDLAARPRRLARRGGACRGTSSGCAGS